MRVVLCCLLTVLVFAFAPDAFAIVWHVPVDAPTIQAGIDSASAGDTVEVACGTYYEYGLSMKSGVVLRSETGEADCVTIDATNDETLYVMGCVTCDATTLVEGFTMINGSKLYDGGGVYCQGYEGRFVNCIIANNSCTVFGGGMYCGSCSPTLSHCTFYGNSSLVARGGGICCSDASPTIDNTIIAFNTNGEGIFCVDSSPILTCCDIFGNAGGDWVGYIVGQEGVNGNFSADPVFCDPINDDHHLRWCSPCLDAPGCGLVGALGACDAPGAVVWYILPDSTGDAISIQDGIDKACPGDTVLVSAGIYYEHDIVMKSGIVLLSEEGPDSTTIDALLDGRVFYCNRIDSTSTIEGFTITNGFATGSSPNDRGGGMYCLACSLTISNCIIGANLADWDGGGVYCDSSSAPVMTDCHFSTNTGYSGGAMFCKHGSSPRLTDCAFTGNVANAGGGALDFQWDAPQPVLTRCTFTGNSAGEIGGAIDCVDSVFLTLNECAFLNNTAILNEGGAIDFRFDSSGDVTGCTFAGNSAGSQGGAIDCYSGSSPTIIECSFYGNSAGGPNEGCISCRSNSSPALHNTIIAFSTDGDAVYCDGTSSAALTCCDVYGNDGGDYAGCIVGLNGVDGNISADPEFCDAAGGDFYLMSTSPCLYGPCGQIGAYGQGCLSIYPRIMSILDVGNDQGREVRIRWQRSAHDAAGSDTTITGYGLYRRQDEYKAAKDGGRRLDGWDWVGTVPARADSIYQFVAPTVCDTTLEEGICWSTFFVSAMTEEPWVYYDSPPDSGYSVDNLAPEAPAGLADSWVSGDILLTWDPNEEEDLNYYAVYRNTTDDFGTAGEPIGYSTTESYTDEEVGSDPEYYYWTTAWDFAGNESDPSTRAMTGIEETAARAPTSFYLGAAVPNPFNPVTEISYGIPTGAVPSRVILKVYDSAGRLVTTLSDAERGAGTYRATWTGTDHKGTPVASGVYFYRIEWNGRSETKRMVLLK